MKHAHTHKLAAAAALTLAFAPGACAGTPTSIGINFTGSGPGGTTYPLGYGTLAGVVPNSNFNDEGGNIGAVSFGSIFDSAGNANGALSYTAVGGGASQTDSTKGANYTLTSGYVDISGPGDSISLTGFGYAKYDAYVFIDGATSSTVAYTANTTNAQAAMNGTAFNGTFKMATMTTPGDYIKFTGLTGDFTLKAALLGAAPVDGLEIVNTAPAPVPESGTAISFGILLALGGALLAARARKAGQSARRSVEGLA